MIVTRGLGYKGIIVTAGLALGLGVIVIPPQLPVMPGQDSWNNWQRFVVEAKIAATVKIPQIRARGILEEIEARGSAYVSLYMPSNQHSLNMYKPSGSASASIVGVRADSHLGEILASGEHDMEDEEILAMILSLLNP